MKQSTKLLSLVLALVMAFSCMTVIGNAALVKSEVKYDSLDDAAHFPSFCTILGVKALNFTSLR